jgi:hypothetical protein
VTIPATATRLDQSTDDYAAFCIGLQFTYRRS